MDKYRRTVPPETVGPSPTETRVSSLDERTSYPIPKACGSPTHVGGLRLSSAHGQVVRRRRNESGELRLSGPFLLLGERKSFRPGHGASSPDAHFLPCTGRPSQTGGSFRALRGGVRPSGARVGDGSQ